MATVNMYFLYDGYNKVPNNLDVVVKNVTPGSTVKCGTKGSTYQLGTTNSVRTYEVTIPVGYEPSGNVKGGIMLNNYTQDYGSYTWDSTTRIMSFKAPNSALIGQTQYPNVYNIISLQKEPDNTKVRLNVQNDTGVTSNYSTTPEFPKGIHTFRFEVIETKKFTNNRIEIRKNNVFEKYVDGATPNARFIEFDYDVQEVTTMIAYSEDLPLNTVKFTETLGNHVTSNTGGSSDSFEKGEFDFNYKSNANDYMFTDNAITFKQGTTTEQISTEKPYQNVIDFKRDITEDFSIVANTVLKPTGEMTENLTRCKSDYTGKRLNFPYGAYTFTFTADENCVFQTNGMFTIRDKVTNEVIWSDTIIPTNQHTFSYTIDNSLGGIVGNFEIRLRATTTIIQATNFVNVYMVDDEQMQQVAKQRYIYTVNEGNINVSVDKGKNIVKILNMPFEIPEQHLISSVIRLGVYDTKIPTNLIDNYVLDFNIGNIKTPLKFNNALDYVNTTIELYLPYVDMIELEPSYVLNETISITYTYNLYNGDVVVNIFSSKTGDKPFHSVQTNVSQNVPFLPTEIYGVNQANNIEMLFNNKIKQAKIHVIRNVPIINEFGIPVNATDTLSKFHGYSEVSSLKLNSQADDDEKNEIKRILIGGVVLP